MAFLIVCISSACSNASRRNALRRSWFLFKTTSNPWLDDQQRESIVIRFIVSADTEALAAEQAEHGDLMLLDALEGYHHLWRKTLTSLEFLEQRYQYQYYMHADDDSYVRLDLLMQLLANSPRKQFYWGYIWNGTDSRVTQPIRNPKNKSHMPAEQYALDYYPPFASGCGFILSRDLVQALLRQPLPDYRLLDPPFGIHLCGNDFCVLPGGPVTPVHDDCVRPYRGIPIFKPTTMVQHYLTPEEMVPFHRQVLEVLQQQPQHQRQQQQDNQQPLYQGLGSQHSAATVQSTETAAAGGSSDEGPSSAADELYTQLVSMGLLRR